jgi:hypothetical protein
MGGNKPAFDRRRMCFSEYSARWLTSFKETILAASTLIWFPVFCWRWTERIVKPVQDSACCREAFRLLGFLLPFLAQVVQGILLHLVTKLFRLYGLLQDRHFMECALVEEFNLVF